MRRTKRNLPKNLSESSHKNNFFVEISILLLIFLIFNFSSCTNQKIESEAEYTLRAPAQESLEFNETWSFVLQGREEEYKPEMPVTDLCYYYTDINCYGELIDIPNRAKLTVNEGTRVHFGMCCQSTSLTHFVISPEYGLRDRIIKEIVKAAKAFDGIQLDFEYVPRRDKKKYLDFIQKVREEINAQNKEGDKNQMLSVCLPGRYKDAESDFFTYKEIAKLCDRVFIMAYDEHWATSQPGPVASTEWSKKVVDFALTQIPQEKLIMGMPFYGRTWNDKSTAKAWYFTSLQQNMIENGVKDVYYENDIPMFKYKTEIEVTGYFNDNYSVLNLCDIYQKAGIDKVGFWRIGFESEDFWNYIKIRKED